jgi:hypothetical protein
VKVLDFIVVSLDCHSIAIPGVVSLSKSLTLFLYIQKYLKRQLELALLTVIWKDNSGVDLQNFICSACFVARSIEMM